MNSDRNLLKRLLKAYPVKVLKDVFDITGLSQNEVIDEVLNTNSVLIVKNFAFTNFSHLRQHVYIYNITGVMDNAWICDNEVYHNQTVTTPTNRILNLFFKATYKVYNTQTNAIEDVLYYTPVQIKIINTKLIISINIQERDATSLFQVNTYPISKDMLDDEIIKYIVERMPLTASLTRTDINRGIKQLWEEDFIDAASVKFKKARSTSMEVMDEEFTLKVSMPDVYNTLLNAPLQKNIFKVLEREDIISHFTTEPTIGKLSFTKFPDNINSIPELINLILIRN
jgi:hypothetical protein